ncbi:LysR family transcriptional regulator [Gayadomonas joobiniege]|uniref:LysR family transcriptional regulator n=1 Tax=Gayadomonas joobiniege TaxID=1234606 RepID=UPI00035DF467|nr:LysR family transcriptional regulator [Gayadomonas joobiniege]
MDTDLANTFIAVVESGSFIAAAEKLHISQTAVTARIKNLEHKLKCTLLIRNKKGVTLTDNGQRFLPYARQILQLWQTSQREIPLLKNDQKIIRLACEQSLWNPVLAEWIAAIRAKEPNLVIVSQVLSAEQINQDIRNGFIDIALTHQPIYGGQHMVEHILDEKLVLIENPVSSQYIYVDWGTVFAEQFRAAHPSYVKTALYFDFGPAALQYLLEYGGQGYFRTRVIHKHLNKQELRIVPDAAEFSYPVYLMYQTDNSETLMPARFAIKKIINQNNQWF